MNSVLRELSRPLTSSHVDAKLGQIACWVCSGLVLFAGLFKLTKLRLSEAELFFGVLQVLAVVLLGVLIGLVLPLVVVGNGRDSTSRSSCQENNS